LTTGKGWLMGDYPMWLYIASVTKLHYLDECMGVYRVLPHSASHGSADKRIRFWESYRDIRIFFCEEYDKHPEKKYLILRGHFKAIFRMRIMEFDDMVDICLRELPKCSYSYMKEFFLKITITNRVLSRLLRIIYRIKDYT
jgi:hypothetical protein